MDLVNEQIGAEGHVKIVIKDGKIALVGTEITKGVGIDISVSVSVDYFLDELAKLIPGTFDDSIISIAKAALRQL